MENWRDFQFYITDFLYYQPTLPVQPSYRKYKTFIISQIFQIYSRKVSYPIGDFCTKLKISTDVNDQKSQKSQKSQKYQKKGKR